MKILILSPYFAPCTIVGALRMSSLVADLLNNGHDISVIKLSDTLLPDNIMTGQAIDGVHYYSINALPYDKLYVNSLRKNIDYICNAHKYDCCVASFGPYEGVNAITEIRTKYHIPLVVDFRDLWLEHPRPRLTWKSKLAYLYDRVRYGWAERKLMQVCDSFVSVTPKCVKTMVNKYPFLADKSICIYNGYNSREMIINKNEKKEDSVFRFFILGKFAYYNRKGALYFLKAVRNAFEQGFAVEIHHVGSAEPDVKELIDLSDLPDGVYFECGQHNYEDMIRLSNRADAFISIDSDPFGIPTKIFDYLYLNKPVISYGPKESEYQILLSQLENAYICDNMKEIGSAVLQLVQSKTSILTSNDAFRQSFSRKAQNLIFEEHLRNVVSKNIENLNE